MRHSLLPGVKYILAVALLLAACAAPPTPTATPTTLPPPTAAPATATLTLTLPPPTFTPTLTPTPSVTPTPSATPTPTSVVTQYDIIIEPQLSPDLKPDGVLVVVPQKNQYTTGYLLDLPNARKQLLLGGQVYIPAAAELNISPDRKRLAYIVFPNTLHIVTADRQQQAVHRWPDSQYVEIIGWLDNQRLSLVKHPQDDGTVIVYDPLTQNAQEVAPAFPASSTTNGVIVPFDVDSDRGVVIYDPTLTRAVFDRFVPNRFTYELWDVQSKKMLWEASPAGLQSRPIWSPDGTRFAVVAAFGGPNDADYGALYVVDRDGQETRLTNFVAGNMAWSLDGHFIATWWRHPHPLYGEDLQPLAIVDETSREVGVYVFSNSRTSTGYPIWSPDGQWIAFNNYIGESIPDEGGPNSVILLNIAQRRAFEVARNVLVRGWMAATP